MSILSDKLLINLKILSKIQKNGKITRSYDGIISLDHETFYQPIRRFISSDSRKQAIFEINSIITEAIESFSNILNSKFTNKNYCNTDEYKKNCDNLRLLLNEIELAKIGVENLKFTYQNDQNVVSQLDIIILKMNTTINDVSNKLLYYQSFLPTSNNATLQNNQNNNTLHDLTSIKVEQYDHSLDIDVKTDVDMSNV